MRYSATVSYLGGSGCSYSGLLFCLISSLTHARASGSGTRLGGRAERNDISNNTLLWRHPLSRGCMHERGLKLTNPPPKSELFDNDGNVSDPFADGVENQRATGDGSFCKEQEAAGFVAAV